MSTFFETTVVWVQGGFIKSALIFDKRFFSSVLKLAQWFFEVHLVMGPFLFGAQLLLSEYPS